MPSVYQLKSRFQRLLCPAVGLLVKWEVHPNTVTLFGGILSIAAGVLLWNSYSPFLLPAVLLLRMAVNAVDGMLARARQLTTPLGALLNETVDVVSDVVLYLPILKMTSIRAEWMILVISGAIITEMTGVLIVTLGGQRRYDGPMGKSDRALVFGLLGVVLGFGMPTDRWINEIAQGLLVLLGMTIWNRSVHGLRSISADPKASLGVGPAIGKSLELKDAFVMEK